MDEDTNWLPWVLGAVLVGALLAAVLLPAEWLDIRPDGEDPVADAGPDITVALGDSAVLDGSGSSDDKGIRTYEWKVVEGTETVFLRGARVTFLFGAPGEYVATLEVTDHAGRWDADEVRVTVLDGAG